MEQGEDRIEEWEDRGRVEERTGNEKGRKQGKEGIVEERTG